MATNKEDAKAYGDRVKKYGLPFICVGPNNKRDHEKETEIKKSLGIDP